MSIITPEILGVFQQNPANIRNICILAHVDHGKTTITDFLLASNGVISNKLAGKVCLLDSRTDEQERGITMKSSSVALAYKRQPKQQWQILDEYDDSTDPSAAATTTTAPSSARNDLFLVNVIDSPGHVDFSSEVASAARISDGCLVLVDVVEGFSVQTHAVLHQAWLEGVKPCLVLGKMDRLITEVKLTPLEAYQHCKQIIEHVNAIVSTFQTAEAMMASYLHSSVANQDKESTTTTTSTNTNTDSTDTVGATADTQTTTTTSDELSPNEKSTKEKDKEKSKDKKSKKEKDKEKEKDKTKDGKKSTSKSSSKSDQDKSKKEKKDKKSKSKSVSDDDKESNNKNNTSTTTDPTTSNTTTTNNTYSVDIDDDSKWVFDPSLGNVAFVSAWDAFGFTITQFAVKYAPMFGCTVEQAQQYLWGDHYLTKSNKITTKAHKSKTGRPLFVDLILQPVYDIYITTLGALPSEVSITNSNTTVDVVSMSIDNTEDLLALAAREKVPVQPLDIGQGAIGWDWRARVRGYFSRWLPLAESLLQMTTSHLPSPVVSQYEKISRIMPDLLTIYKAQPKLLQYVPPTVPPGSVSTVSLPPSQQQQAQPQPRFDYNSDEFTELEKLAHAAITCDPKSPFLLVYVSKMIDVRSLSVMAQRRDRTAAAGGSGAPTRRPVQRPGVPPPAPVSTPNPAIETANTTDQQQQQQQQPSPAAQGPLGTGQPVGKSAPAQGGRVVVMQSAEEIFANSTLMALARVFAGTLTSQYEDNQDTTTMKQITLEDLQSSPNLNVVVAYSPQYDPSESKKLQIQHSTVITGSLRLFSLMGRDCQPIHSIPSGNICGITGLDEVFYKFFALSNVTSQLPKLKPLTIQTRPILEVVVEPISLSDFNALTDALKLLDVVDPNITVGLNDRGEHYISASGELHLERCLRDLQDHFAPNIELRVHPPTVAYRETVVSGFNIAQNNPTQVLQLSQTLDQKNTQHLYTQYKEAFERTLGLDGINQSGGGNLQDGGDTNDGGDQSAANAQVLALQAQFMKDITRFKHGSWIRNGVFRLNTPSNHVQLRIRALPLPAAVTSFLENNDKALRGIFKKINSSKLLIRSILDILVTNNYTTDQCVQLVNDLMAQANKTSTTATTPAAASHSGDGTTDDVPVVDRFLSHQEIAVLQELRTLFSKTTVKPRSVDDKDHHLYQGLHVFDSTQYMLKEEQFMSENALALRDLFSTGAIVDYITGVSRKNTTSNLLVNTVPFYSILSSLTSTSFESTTFQPVASHLYALTGHSGSFTSKQIQHLRLAHHYMKYVENTILLGFEQTCQAGPMCGEPLMGVCFVIDRLSINPDYITLPHNSTVSFPMLQTQLRNSIMEACVHAFDARPRRLMEAVFHVEMQCVAEMLGRLVGVITRRRGRVITDGDVIEGTSFFLVKAILPVQASFGFVSEVRERTSGQTNPILYFSHWEVLPIDPFFVPTTEQEIEEIGIDGGYNLAKNLITDVRKNKGLAIDDVVVAAPEKQRTLARKK